MLTSTNSSGNLIAAGCSSYPKPFEQQFAMHRRSAPIYERFSTAAKIEATRSLLPRKPNRLTPVGIANPLLHNPLNYFANTRISPCATVPGKGSVGTVARSGFSAFSAQFEHGSCEGSTGSPTEFEACTNWGSIFALTMQCCFEMKGVPGMHQWFLAHHKQKEKKGDALIQ